MEPLAEFFDQYSPYFLYDPSEPANSEFYRLCDEQGWKRGNPDREAAHEDFKIALTQQFNRNYGTDENDLGSWQLLCRTLGIYPVPNDLEEARMKVKTTHVNLVDLTDGFGGGREIIIFPTEQALSEYTKANGRIFPREEAYAGGLLRHLLRRIMHPRTPEEEGLTTTRGTGRRQRTKRRGRK